MRILLSVFVALCALAAPAKAVTVTFTGLGGADSGVIGHAQVATSATAPGAAAYAPFGVSFIYTALVSPDAWDTTNGIEVATGTFAPGVGFGGAATAPHGLEAAGITGDIHIGIAGMTLDYTNPSDLFFSDPFHETRFYRGGTAEILEEVSPGVYNTLASYVDVVFEINIDYSTGAIANSVTATRVSGSALFPESWTGTSFDPVDVLGTTPEGAYGGFSAESTLEFDTAQQVPEPVALALFGLGLASLGLARRRQG